MKRSPGLVALILGLTVALAACGGGPSAATVNAWQSGTGGKDVTKVAQYLAAANQAVLSGNMTDALGGGVLPFGLALQAAGGPPPADGAFKQEMADLQAYGKALMGLDKDSDISVLTGPLDQAQTVLDQHKTDWWTRKLDDAMKVRSQ